MFSAISKAIRLNAAPGEVRQGFLLATEILASKVGHGNLVEIAASRVALPLEPTDRLFHEDWFAGEVVSFCENGGLSPPHVRWSKRMSEGRPRKLYDLPVVDFEDAAPFIEVEDEAPEEDGSVYQGP